MGAARSVIVTSRALRRLLVVAAMVTAGLAAASLPAGAQTYPSTEYDLMGMSDGRAHGQILWQSTSATVQGDLSDQDLDGAGATVVFDFYQQGRYLGTRSRTVPDGAALRFSFAHGGPPGGFTLVTAHVCAAAGSCGPTRAYARPR